MADRSSAGRVPGRRQTGALLLLAGAVAAAVLAITAGSDPPLSRGAVDAVSPATASVPAPLVVPDLPDDQPVARPVRLRIPAIGVRTGLERLRLATDGSLRTPRDPGRAGWFGDGPRPGEVGPAVVVGHVDSVGGPAVFWDLGRLRPGDLVQVRAGDGTRRDFRVQRVRLVPQNRFPSDLVYAPTPSRALRLITCGGSYDHVRGHYRSNVVVFAEQV